jgi:branched-chain amino acid transport system ATP-binding protein
MLLVEQDVQKSLSLSVRGYVLENGEIILEGKAKDLLENAHLRKAYLGL